MKEVMVSDSLNSMYEDYYENDPRTLLKRELTALEVFQHIQQVYDHKHVGKLLDVGAGEGSLLQRLGQSGFADALYGVEISQSGINAIRSKDIPDLVEVLQFDGYKIPYADQFFDVAIASHVLEHVEHERLFLAELKRVAKDVLIEIPLEHNFRVQRAIQGGRKYGHINFYTADTFVNLLDTSGLKCKNYQVVTLSSAFESFMYGKFKGTVKSLIRQSLLKVAPRLATSLMVYFCMANCSSSD
jgi:ubiquinone/menaquinone biosynthesis C-methylase UbiE